MRVDIEEIELANLNEQLFVGDAYTTARRAMLERLDIVPIDIHAVHETSEGSVYLWVSEGDENCWIARIQGCESDSGYIATSRGEAIRQNGRRFRGLFPEHTCSGACVRHEQ
jgi:hypothetical protein